MDFCGYHNVPLWRKKKVGIWHHIILLQQQRYSRPVRRANKTILAVVMSARTRRKHGKALESKSLKWFACSGCGWVKYLFRAMRTRTAKYPTFCHTLVQEYRSLKTKPTALLLCAYDSTHITRNYTEAYTHTRRTTFRGLSQRSVAAAAES